jgi:hypothetical protein
VDSRSKLALISGGVLCLVPESLVSCRLQLGDSREGNEGRIAIACSVTRGASFRRRGSSMASATASQHVQGQPFDPQGILRQELAQLRIDDPDFASDFADEDLDKLLRAGYRRVQNLRDAGRVCSP